MNAGRIAAVAGTLGLVHGGFGHAEETHPTQMGAMAPLEHKEAPSLPVWASLGTIAMGRVRRLLGGRKR